MPMKYTKEALDHLKRKQLQKLCMDNNIKANGKNVVLIEQLLEVVECDEKNGPLTTGADEEIKLPTGHEKDQNDASADNGHACKTSQEDKDNHDETEKETDQDLAADSSNAKNDDHDDKPILINQSDNTATVTQFNQTAEIEVTGKESACTDEDVSVVVADGVLQEKTSLVANTPATNNLVSQQPSSTKGMEDQESHSTKKKTSYKPYTGPLPAFNGDSTFTPKGTPGKKPLFRESVKDMSIHRSGHKNRREKYLQDAKNRQIAARNQNRTPLKK